MKWLIGLITLVLVGALTVQVIKAPTFMLPSTFLAIIIIVAVVVGSLVVSGIIKLIFEKTSFFIVLCLSLSIISIIFMIKFSSPKLTVVVPKGYTGQVTLVLSNVDENILTVDSNGIGYINKQTFDKLYAKPTVLELDGTDINDQCVGFNPSTFWAKGKFSSIPANGISENGEIEFLSFEIVPKDKKGEKQYYSPDLINLINKAKLPPNE